MTQVPEKLLDFINEEINSLDYQLVDIILRGRASFEIILDKSGGITLDECAEFNRSISAWIDREKMFSGEYTLDVSSPGIDRALKSDGDFLWATGKLVEVKVYEPVDEKREFAGKLLKAEGDNIILKEESGSEISVSRKNIAKAKLKVCI